MNCDEKQRLLKVYEAATSQFSQAVTAWHSKLGISAQEEYKKLRRTAEEARVESERARQALERHISSHGC